MNAMAEKRRSVAPLVDDSTSLLLEELLSEQSTLRTAVDVFSEWHDEEPMMAGHYRQLMPMAKPGRGEQYAFEVKLDECTGCKACVAACHSLNGLDEDESWRDVGALITRNAPVYQQTVTTACHHCEDPACANGCPVLAYEKDAETGIVRHLDDQCIGCSYCILKCPYEVPKFNLRLGIVRKCDMCASRLAEGEAPACVQACPNGAIGIQIVKRQVELNEERLLPGVVSSDYTRPTTRYVSKGKVPAVSMAADEAVLRVEHSHWPLVVMLVLTQAALGIFFAVAMSGTGEVWLAWLAYGLLQAGLGASVLHLGQPLRAWRAFLGWRRSWLSREIMVFGGFAGAGAAVLMGCSAWWAVILGSLGVMCSIMVYVDTRRPDWSGVNTSLRFGGTVVVFASLGMVLVDRDWLPWAMLAQGMKAGWEVWMVLRHPQSYFGRMHLEMLPGWSVARVIGAILVLALTWVVPELAVVGLLVTEGMERVLYFKTVKAWRMPGL
jgi:Fe-S-cluster-containing dehydrogenase component/DMSO reductase anchor subunit